MVVTLTTAFCITKHLAKAGHDMGNCLASRRRRPVLNVVAESLQAFMVVAVLASLDTGTVTEWTETDVLEKLPIFS